MAIWPGTAPVHTFKISYDATEVEKLRVNYAQREKLILTKSGADVSMEGNLVRVKLTQKDTLKFMHTSDVEIQIDLLTKDGKPDRSHILKTSAARVLNREVLE